MRITRIVPANARPVDEPATKDQAAGQAELWRVSLGGQIVNGPITYAAPGKGINTSTILSASWWSPANRFLNGMAVKELLKRLR